MKNFKKYAEAIVSTVFKLAIIALIVALAIFLSGRGDIVNATVQAILWLLHRGCSFSTLLTRWYEYRLTRNKDFL
jgi:hypothetical protein